MGLCGGSPLADRFRRATVIRDRRPIRVDLAGSTVELGRVAIVHVEHVHVGIARARSRTHHPCITISAVGFATEPHFLDGFERLRSGASRSVEAAPLLRTARRIVDGEPPSRDSVDSTDSQRREWGMLESRVRPWGGPIPLDSSLG